MATKWLPIYLPPEPWEIIANPPTNPRQAPQPPAGQAVYWWKLPKSTWPYRDEMPFEPKVLGALPASQISMPEDLQNWPPLGVIKLKVPGQIISSGQQISFMNMQIHTRRISPDEMKVKTAITPLAAYCVVPGL